MLEKKRGHSDSIALAKSLLIAAPSPLSHRPCPLRRFAPALPKGEPLADNKTAPMVQQHYEGGSFYWKNIRGRLSLFPACQQGLDLLDGVDDAGNGHIVVQGHDKVSGVLGD